jgi:hypothetical protein
VRITQPACDIGPGHAAGSARPMAEKHIAAAAPPALSFSRPGPYAGCGAILAGGLLGAMTAKYRLGEAAAAILLLLAPALWNRFPFLQYDTGGYLARWFEGYLVPSRSTVYGLFALAGWPLDFWPVVTLQAAAAVWVLSLVLRVHGLGSRRLALFGIAVLLGMATSLPWLADVLITDIFAGTSVLVLHLILFAPDSLGRSERILSMLFVAFAASTHSATFAVLLAIVACAALARLIWRDPMVALWRGAGAIALGALMLLTANFALSGDFAWTPGGYGLVFARMLQDGIVTRYLDAHCAERKLKLCPYSHELPRDADDFLWSGGPFDELGRFDGLGEEMRTIVLESVAEYPGAQIEAVLANTAHQLVMVASGEGVLTSIWHTYGIIDRYLPAIAPAMRAARQQRGEVSFAALNALHLPIAVLSLLALPLVIWFGLRYDSFDLARLAATVAVAILANAAVCGAVSSPHDRYGARLAWIATLAVVLVPMRLKAGRQAKAGRMIEAVSSE